jgi:hemoglobin/transferrin/lactoferrin receptor protein
VIDGLNQVTKLNAGEGRTEGIETRIGWRMTDSLKLTASLALMDGEIDTFPTSAPVLVRESLDRLMPPTGQFTLEWAPPERRYWLAFDLTTVDEQRELSTRDISDNQRVPPLGTPGYVVADLRGGFAFSTGTSINARLGNVGDKNYRVHGSGVNEPGREFVLTVEQRF